MAKARYTGKDVIITFGAITANFKSFEITISGEKWIGTASDSGVIQRGTGALDAAMTLVGWDSDDSGAGDFDEVAALVLSKAAPSALSWTDDAGTPVSKLPSDFFTTYFPLADWRVDSARGGSGGPNDPADWTAVLSPNNID